MTGKLKVSWQGYDAGSIQEFGINEYRRLIELGIIEPSRQESEIKQVSRPPKDKMIKHANKAKGDT